MPSRPTHAALACALVGLVVSALLGSLACSPAADTGPTWFHDAQPIVAAHCASCHTTGGIAPMALQTFADVQAHKKSVRAQVAAGVMPPWPPAEGCNTYLHDRSLPAAEKATLLAWLDRGAPQGDPSTAPVASGALAAGGLSRVDSTLKLPESYQPVLSPDEYRCFVLDWPQTATRYVTGFQAVPGNAALVHHVIAFLATPGQAAAYQRLDDAEPGQGYTCFGGSGGPSQQMLGAWAPGGVGTDFPFGTGIKVLPGSKIILQVHYNTGAHPNGVDQSAVQFKLDDTVGAEAAVLPWANPDWLSGKMPIPAGNADVVHSFSYDPTRYLNYITSNVLKPGKFHLYSAALHQHLRGSRARLEILRGGTKSECLLDIPRWDFHWQGSYGFENPVVFEPGDSLQITCHWDNSAANQPVMGSGSGGAQAAPKDLNWGEGTGDEMCLGFFYITQ